MVKVNVDENIVVHFLQTGLTYSKGGGSVWTAISEVSRRGQTVVFTPEDIAATRDRLGRSWLLDAIDDPEAQIRRWGKVMFGRGPFPTDESPYRWGSPEWQDARESARRSAWARPENERADALAEVQRRFGSPAPTSRTIATIASDEDRAKAWERIRADEDGGD